MKEALLYQKPDNNNVRCNSELIERSGFGIIQNNIKDGNCPDFGTKIAGVGLYLMQS